MLSATLTFAQTHYSTAQHSPNKCIFTNATHKGSVESCLVEEKRDLGEFHRTLRADEGWRKEPAGWQKYLVHVQISDWLDVQLGLPTKSRHP